MDLLDKILGFFSFGFSYDKVSSWEGSFRRILFFTKGNLFLSLLGDYELLSDNKSFFCIFGSWMMAGGLMLLVKLGV
jgi:hypothetical protein